MILQTFQRRQCAAHSDVLSGSSQQRCFHTLHGTSRCFATALCHHFCSTLLVAQSVKQEHLTAQPPTSRAKLYDVVALGNLCVDVVTPTLDKVGTSRHYTVPALQRQIQTARLALAVAVRKDS